MMTESGFYLSEQEARRRRRRRFTTVLAVLLALCGAVWGSVFAVIRAPWFQIRNVEITGNERVSREAVSALLSASIPRGVLWERAAGFRNILVWPESLTDEDLRLLPQLKSVEMERHFREKEVVVRVRERRPFAIWCGVSAEATACLWFDEEGVVLERAPAAEGNLVWVVNDSSGRALHLGERVLREELIPHLFSVFRVLAAAGVSVRELKVEDIGLEEAGVSLYDGPDLYFSLRFSSDAALGVLQSLVSSDSFKTLKYVDFRAENRAYYK